MNQLEEFENYLKKSEATRAALKQADKKLKACKNIAAGSFILFGVIPWWMSFLFRDASAKEMFLSVVIGLIGPAIVARAADVTIGNRILKKLVEENPELKKYGL
jgi:hypothetical protein